jgi:hypothetical protein
VVQTDEPQSIALVVVVFRATTSKGSTRDADLWIAEESELPAEEFIRRWLYTAVTRAKENVVLMEGSNMTEINPAYICSRLGGGDRGRNGWYRCRCPAHNSDGLTLVADCEM